MNANAETKEANPAEQEALEFRLQRLAELVVHGASRADVIEMAMRRWQVSRRTAESYAQQVRDRLTGESACNDRLFYLTLSQLQRDQLVGLALRYTMNTVENFDPQVMQSLSAMITAVRGLLDSRDRAAAEIYQLVQEKIDAAKKVVRDAVSAADSSAAERRSTASEAKPAAANGTPRNGKHGATPLPPAVRKRMAESNGKHCIFNGASKLEPDAAPDSNGATTCAGCAASP